MAPSRFVTGVLLALTVLALLPTAVVTGMTLRHPALDSEPATPIDLDNDSMSFPRRMEVQEYMEAMIDPPLYCYTETNFDFVDSDVGNAPASAASQCCSLCHSANNCKAWSWSNFNGGTCWFKSQRSAVIYKPGVQSSLLFYSPQPTCVLQPNTAYAGNDIGSANYPAPSSCCQACKNFPKCRAFTFTNFNGGTCWFKSSNGNAVPAPGAVSAEVYPASVSDPPPTCDSTLKPGVDFFDHDIGNAPSPTAAGCCAICKGWKSPTQCRAFSWTNQNGGTCWLKSETGASVPNLNVISSTVIANPTPPCTIQFGADYFDNDIDNKPGANVFICCDVCKAYPGGGCKAYSWSNHNGGTCWLKGGKGTIIWNGNVHSGVVN